jgi:LAO/AO transport system kinase
VLIYSALKEQGIAELWQAILAHRQRMQSTDALAAKRRIQQVRWMWALVEEGMRERLRADAKVRARLPALEKAVADGKLPPALAAKEIADLIGL